LHAIGTFRSLAPGFVLAADRPGFQDPSLTVRAPSEDATELQILPLVEFLKNKRIGFRNILPLRL
jgi:hypothetical protein